MLFAITKDVETKDFTKLAMDAIQLGTNAFGALDDCKPTKHTISPKIMAFAQSWVEAFLKEKGLKNLGELKKAMEKKQHEMDKMREKNLLNMVEKKVNLGLKS